MSSDGGLTAAEVEARRAEHGYNEVAEKREHPLRVFLGKFWGLSAWMLELIMVLSAVLGDAKTQELQHLRRCGRSRHRGGRRHGRVTLPYFAALG